MESDKTKIVEEPRLRTLTEKAKEEYDSKVEVCKNKLSDLFTNIDDIIKKIETAKEKGLATKSLKQSLITARICYEQSVEQFAETLKKTQTKESLMELTSLKQTSTTVKENIAVTIRDHEQSETSSSYSSIFEPKEKLSSRRSTSSRSSTGSRSRHSSTASSVLLQQRAKAEGARVRLQFAAEEAEIIKRMAEGQAELKLLESRKDLEEAEAELRVMTEMVEIREAFEVESECDKVRTTRSERTGQYVRELQVVAPEHQQQIPSELRPAAFEFNPSLNVLGPRPEGLRASEMTDLTRYIMKKDLILSRLSEFNDEPRRYFVWKSGFKRICVELQLNRTEELDLLCRWLGPESSAQANSLRSANCSNETEAIRKIWDRLDRRYGAPELIVQSFQERLVSFPKLNQNDHIRMYELSDLLSEINSLKQNKIYSSSLAYFDSSAGVNTIVNKIPTFMQGKWTDRALRYKSEHHVLYPCFNVFVEFIQDMAVRMNDPSFRYDSFITTKPSTSYVNKSYSTGQTSNRLVLSTRKTSVVNPELSEIPCPIHGETAKHALRDCRVFEAKSIPDKKAVIMSFGICFKCCMGKHLA